MTAINTGLLDAAVSEITTYLDARNVTHVALANLKEETRTIIGWGVQYAGKGIVLHRGGAWVTITDDGEVISSDPVARLYVHCIYYPEVYMPAPSSASR